AFPRARVFQCVAFLRELAGGRNGHSLDACGGELRLRLGRVDTSIPGDRTGRMAEDRLVMLHGLNRLSMFVGMLQDLVARDDAALDFIKNDVAAELDLGPAFVPRDSTRVRFEEAEDLLVGGNFLPFEDPAARL